MTTWLSNYKTMEEAESAAKRLNDLAEKGNTVMNCSFYFYSTGEATHSEMKGGLYREKTDICRHCGKVDTAHQGEATPGNPCGRKFHRVEVEEETT